MDLQGDYHTWVLENTLVRITLKTIFAAVLQWFRKWRCRKNKSQKAYERQKSAPHLKLKMRQVLQSFKEQLFE